MRSIFFNKKNQVRSGWKILMVSFISVILLLVITFILSSLEVKDKYGVSVFVAFLGALYIMLKMIDKKGFDYLGLKSIRERYTELIIGLLAGSFFIVLNVIILRISGILSFSNNILNPNISISLLEGLLLFSIVAFAEELLFRGYIIMSLQQMGKWWLSILISALIFALTHGALNDNASFLAVINLLLGGILLGYMYVKTKSIYMPIGFHLTWNYFQGYIFGIQVSGREVGEAMYIIEVKNHIMSGGSFGLEGGLGNTIVVMLSIIFVFLYCKKKTEFISINNI